MGRQARALLEHPDEPVETNADESSQAVQGEIAIEMLLSKAASA